MDDEIDFFSDVDPADLSDVVVEESEAAQGGVRSKIDRVVGGARLRLSRGDGSGDLLNADARLSSVVSESTPGAALELLRLNTPFTFPDLNASVMLVLPTVGDFGGLSRRSKDEARGTIINLQRKSLVMEIYNPYSIVQVSEVLSELSVRMVQMAVAVS